MSGDTKFTIISLAIILAFSAFFTFLAVTF